MNKKNLDDFEKKIQEKVNKSEDSLLDSEVETENSGNYDISLNTTKDRISKLPWLIGFFLIVFISITACFMFLNNNPQTSFTVAVDELFSSVIDNINDNAYDISKSDIKIDMDIKGKEDIYKELSKNKIDINYVLDSSNNRSFFKVKTLYNNEESINLNLYNNKNSTYIYFKNVYDKYIKYENKPYKPITNKDVKTLLNGVNQAIDKVATKEKVIGSKANFDYDIKTIKVQESKLIIDSDNYKRVSKTFVNSLKSNEEFINSASKILSISSADTKKKLDKLQIVIENYLKEAKKTEVIISSDRKKHNFVQGLISSKLGTYKLTKKPDHYLISIDDFKNKIQLDSNIKLESNKKKTKFNTTINTKFDFKKENVKGEINIKYENKQATVFPNVNMKEVVSEGEISEVDKIAIYSKLFENKSISNLIEILK